MREILDNLTLRARKLKGSGNTSSGGGCRLIAAIYINKRFVTFGYNSNKSNPFQMKYGKNDKSIFFHAETNAIKRAINLVGFDEFKRSKTTMFIVRIKKKPNSSEYIWGLSKPCRGCTTAIIDMNINNIIYTLDEDQTGVKAFEIMTRKDLG